MKKRFTILIAAIAAILMMAQPGKVMGQVSVGDVMWSEDWYGTTSGTATSTQYDMISTCSNNSDITYSTTGTVKLYYETYAGETAPELYMKSGSTWTISNIPTGSASQLTLTYASNNTKSSVTCSTQGASITGSSKSYTITTGGATTITLVFGCSGNTRIDNISLTVKTVGGGSTPTNYTLTYSANPAAGGTVTVNNSTTGTASVAANTAANISAEANSGYVFSGWEQTSGNGSFGNASSASTTFTMGTADATIRANFNQVTTYTVTFDAGDGTFVGNDAFPNTSNQKAAGTYLLPSATPAEGYNFDGWVISGSSIARTGNYTVSAAVSFTASYSQFGGGNSQTTTFDFEANGAHNNGTNNYTNAHTYSQNNVNINMTYFDAISNNSISGSYLARGRVKDGTTNSPVMIIGPITITNQTITGIQFKTKGPDLITETFATSTDGTNYTDQLVFTCSSTSTADTKTKGLSITGTNLYLRWTGTVSSSVSGNKDFDIDDIVITYTVVSYTPTVALNNASFGTLAGPTNDVYTVTPNAGYKITGYDKTDNVTVTQQTGDAFSASTYKIIATTNNQTVTFNLAQRTGTTVTLHEGLNGATTTAVNTYTDATLADVIEGHSIASVNGWTALGWVKSYTSGAPTLITTTEAVGETANLYAVYKKGSNTFSRITSADDLAADGVYMICYNSSTTYKFMNDVSTNFMGYTDANSVSENSFEYVAGKKFTLGGSANAYTLYDGSKYLTATSGQQYLGLSSGSTDDVAKWIITFDNNNAKIMNNGLTGNNVYVSYYASNNYFNMYTNYSTIYLFKQITNNLQYSTAPTAEKCSLTYNANGGDGDDVIDNNSGAGYDAGTQVTVKDNDGESGNPSFSKEGHTFFYWSDMEDGNDPAATPYEAGNKIVLNANTTLYAQWIANTHNYTLTSDDHADAELVVDGNTVAAGAKIAYGKEVTVNVLVSNGYIYTISVNNGAVIVNNDKFFMPDDDVTVTVTTQVNPYLTATLSGSDMENMENAGEGYGTTKYVTVNNFYWETTGYQTSTLKNMIQLRTSGTPYILLPNFNGKITKIEFDVTDANSTDGTTTTLLKFRTSATGSDIASGGGTATNKITIDLSSKFYSTGYIVSGGGIRVWSITVTYLPYDNFTDLDPAAAIPTLEAGNNYAVPSDMSTTDLTIPATAGIVVKSGATLTVTGTLTNNGTAANLVVENGGQLVYYDNGAKDAVQATVQKNITGYGTGTSDKWNFIASPITTSISPAAVTNLLGEQIDDDPVTYNYDLYRLNNTTWENYHQHYNDTDSPFVSLVNGQGYLYAKKANTTLSFAGTIKPYDDNYEISVSKGWNLVGNPYTFDAYASVPYYAMDEDGTGITANTVSVATAVKPCTGIVIYADDDDPDPVAFSDEGPVTSVNHGNLQMVLAHNVATRDGASVNSTIDNAIVSFNEGTKLQKFYFGEPAANIFIPQNGEDYAIAFSNRQGDMPLNFKAKELGTYTISFEGEEMDLNGIYLIDMLDEVEIDLSVEPSYTFIGSPADRAARFKIVFRNVNDDNANDIFAYQNGSDIVVTGEGELQIFDVMGRIVSKQYVSGVETININAHGVYIMKLNGMTQKIVVK